MDSIAIYDSSRSPFYEFAPKIDDFMVVPNGTFPMSVESVRGSMEEAVHTGRGPSLLDTIIDAMFRIV